MANLKKRVLSLSLKLNDALTDADKSDKSNYSAAARLARALRDCEKDLRILKRKVVERKKEIKQEFETLNKHRRGKQFGAPKSNLFKKKK
jgi:hypothetical protein